MEKCVSVMSEEYKRKNYGKGVFNSVRKKTAKVSFGVYIFFGVVFAGCAYGIYWSLGQTERYRLAGDEDSVGMGYAIMAFFAVFALISLASIIITIIRHKRGAQKWKEVCAEQSGYTVRDMDEFEYQTMNTECRTIRLLGTAKALAVGQSDGILTRDYIYLADAHHVILKLADLSAACLVKQTVRVKAGNIPGKKNFSYLTVMLLGKNGSSTMAECSQETGRELIDILKQDYPEIDTADGEVISPEAFDELRRKK